VVMSRPTASRRRARTGRWRYIECMRTYTFLLFAMTLAACGGSEPAQPAAEAPVAAPAAEAPIDAPAAERPQLSAEDCAARGGTVVGDIGDGAVHRPDYTCPNGAKPIGAVPSGIEGAVCCGA
jgi:hypothetical protein